MTRTLVDCTPYTVTVQPTPGGPVVAFTPRQDTMTTLTDHQAATLHAGLDWLTNTVQPDTAVITHHGVTAPTTGDLRFRFTYIGTAALITIDRTRAEYDKTRPDCWVMTNPLTAEEVTAVHAAITGWLTRNTIGGRVIDQWNGAGLESGSFRAAVRLSPTLTAAFQRYHAGCPTHDTVFCGDRFGNDHRDESYRTCTWLADGHIATVQPDWPTDHA